VRRSARHISAVGASGTVGQSRRKSDHVKERGNTEGLKSVHVLREGEELNAELQLVDLYYFVWVAVGYTLFTTGRFLAGPIPPHRPICKGRRRRTAGSARLGRDRQACRPPGRRREYGAHIRRVRTEAHGQLPCLRHYAARVRRVRFFSHR
jgi:heme exporter protein D